MIAKGASATFLHPPFQVSDLRFFGMGKDKTKSNLEESYEQANDNQTAVNRETKQKVIAINRKANHGRAFEFDEEV